MLLLRLPAFALLGWGLLFITQVFVSYGSQTNDSLLQFYGFVEVDNPNDSYNMAKCVRHI